MKVQCKYCDNVLRKKYQTRTIAYCKKSKCSRTDNGLAKVELTKERDCPFYKGFTV